MIRRGQINRNNPLPHVQHHVKTEKQSVIAFLQYHSDETFLPFIKTPVIVDMASIDPRLMDHLSPLDCFPNMDPARILRNQRLSLGILKNLPESKRVPNTCKNHNKWVDVPSCRTCNIFLLTTGVHVNQKKKKKTEHEFQIGGYGVVSRMTSVTYMIGNDLQYY